MTDYVIKSSIQETTESTGPGTLDLDGSATGWNRFRTFFADNDYLVYARRSANGSKQQLVRGQLTYGTGAGGRDQLSVVNVLASTDGGASPTAIDWSADDNPCAVFCCPAEDLLDSAIRNHAGASKPAWMKKGLWVADGAGATARKLYWFDGNDDIEIATIDETANTVGLALSGASSVAAAAQPGLLAGLATFQSPGHRLSLTTAVARTVSDVSAAGTIYWTPDKHNVSPIWNGSAWILQALAEKSFVLDATNHAAGSAHDVFLDYNAGTPRIVTVAWSSGTARASAISRDATYGWLVNTSSATARISNNGGTVNIAAGAGLYLGSFYCLVNAQVEDTREDRMLWNMYNRAPRAMQRLEATNSWTYSTGSFRQANGSTDNQLTFFRGLDEDAMTADVIATVISSGASSFPCSAAIGLDSTSAPASGIGFVRVSNVGYFSPTAKFAGFPGLGFHYLAWLESAGGGDTQTWVGDNGGTSFQTGIFGQVMA